MKKYLLVRKSQVIALQMRHRIENAPDLLTIFKK